MSTFAGFLMAAAANLVLLGIAWGSLTATVKASAQKADERHSENQRRLLNIEKALGISNGESVFVRRDEMALRVKAADDAHRAIHDRLDALEWRK